MFSALGLRGAQQPISLGQRHLNNRRWGQLRYAETGRQLNDPVKGSSELLCDLFDVPPDVRPPFLAARGWERFKP